MHYEQTNNKNINSELKLKMNAVKMLDATKAEQGIMYA